MRLVISRALIGLLAAAPLAISGALAQDAGNAAADAAIACLEIEDTEDRLACLEAAAKDLKATRVIIEQDNALAPGDGRTAEDAFGAETLDATKREKREKSKSARLDAKVVEVRVNPYKDITVTLDNGQVWRQLQGDSETVHIPAGERLYTVTLKKGPLGNYRMRVNELKRWIRVTRIK